MARYANIDEVLHNVPIDDMGNVDFITLEKTLIKYTADVVPKSEVDRLVDKWIGEENLTQDAMVLRLIEALRDEAKRYEKYYFNHEYDKLIAEAKQEVAREIFEEIDGIIAYDNFPIAHQKLVSVFAELKKKYTESEGKE